MNLKLQFWFKIIACITLQTFQPAIWISQLFYLNYIFLYIDIEIPVQVNLQMAFTTTYCIGIVCFHMTRDAIYVNRSQRIILIIFNRYLISSS